MKRKSKIDQRKEEVIDKLQGCFENKFSPKKREKLRKVSIHQLQVNLTYALIGQLAGQGTMTIKL